MTLRYYYGWGAKTRGRLLLLVTTRGEIVIALHRRQRRRGIGHTGVHQAHQLFIRHLMQHGTSRHVWNVFYRRCQCRGNETSEQRHKKKESSFQQLGFSRVSNLFALSHTLREGDKRGGNLPVGLRDAGRF